MKKKFIILLIILGIIILALAIILLSKNKSIANSKIEIIDATYICPDSKELFYEDNNYTYSFPCPMSKSVYIKFKNGNKLLVVDALEENKVTIDELIDAGLKVQKDKK